MEKLVPLKHVLYTIKAETPFSDGNMPEGYKNIKQGQVVRDVPGDVLVRILRSDPECFQVFEQEVIPPAQPEPEVVEVSDAAKDLAAKFDIDLDTVEGSGKDGRILKSDIEALIEE